MGPRLVQLRRRYKLSQSKLGEFCGVTKAAVSQWETGISAPEIKKLIELRSKLTFSLDWLIAGEGEPIPVSLEVMADPAERRQDNRRRASRRDRRQHQRREGSSLSNTR
ncbi:MAG: helix-turn-helix transcriptional regulator [Nitrosospira sp.]